MLGKLWWTCGGSVGACLHTDNCCLYSIHDCTLVLSLLFVQILYPQLHFRYLKTTYNRKRWVVQSFRFWRVHNIFWMEEGQVSMGGDRVWMGGVVPSQPPMFDNSEQCDWKVKLGHNKINCFNDPDWATTTQRVLGGVGGWFWEGWVGHTPTTYIQLAGAGSIQ